MRRLSASPARPFCPAISYAIARAFPRRAPVFRLPLLSVRRASSCPRPFESYGSSRELDLTYLEFDLLAHLVAHPYTVHTRDALISGIWGYGHIGDGRTVVRRVGYKYLPDHQ